MARVRHQADPRLQAGLARCTKMALCGSSTSPTTPTSWLTVALRKATISILAKSGTPSKRLVEVADTPITTPRVTTDKDRRSAGTLARTKATLTGTNSFLRIIRGERIWKDSWAELEQGRASISSPQTLPLRSSWIHPKEAWIRHEPRSRNSIRMRIAWYWRLTLPRSSKLTGPWTLASQRTKWTLSCLNFNSSPSKTINLAIHHSGNRWSKIYSRLKSWVGLWATEGTTQLW